MSLVFKLAEKMVRLSPELSKIVRIVPSKKMLIGLVCNIEYRAISAEADAFVEAIETSLGAYDDQLFIAISTQAATDGDLFSIWLDDASAAKISGLFRIFIALPKIAKFWTRKRGS